ncbi:MAG: helix-turn-helix domain-containing protein [Qingshengfaniella sp.]
MNCEKISERSHIHGWTVEPHFHEGLVQLFVFGSGVVHSQIETTPQVIVGPALVWMPAMVPHAFTYPSDMVGWVITVPSADVTRIAKDMPWLESWVTGPQVISGSETTEFMKECIWFAQTATKELHRMDETRNVALEGLFRLLVINCHRALATLQTERPVLSDRRLGLLRGFQEMLDHHLETPRSVADYAERLAVTTTHLSRTVKAFTGRTAGELIADRILLEAKRKLVFSDTSVGEIGYALQFSSPSYFSRFFTNLTGESPKAYRARMRQGTTIPLFPDGIRGRRQAAPATRPNGPAPTG